jgi:hypothetical protein
MGEFDFSHRTKNQLITRLTIIIALLWAEVRSLIVIHILVFMTTVLSLDAPKYPLKRGTLSKFPVPPF